MRQAVLSLLLACEPEQGFFESGSCVRFLRSWSFQKTFAEAMVLLFVCAVPGWKRSVPERQCHWRFPWLRQWRQWRRAEVTGAGGTGRKLAFCWRSCTQGRHAGGNCGAGWSEGGSPLSRDGALLYPSGPGAVVIGVSYTRAKAVLRFRSCRAGLVVIVIKRRDETDRPLDARDGIAVNGCVSWPARPAGCANGAKRSAALVVSGVSGWL